MKNILNPRFAVPPAYPHSAQEIFRRLRLALADNCGGQPSYARLGQMMAQPESKAHFWFNVFSHPHVIGFLCLLERLPLRKRVEFVDWLCRELPELDNPRLAHDPVAVSCLKRLLTLTDALIMVRGGSDFQRGFVATAIGHSYLKLDKSHVVTGIDLAEPRTLVPIESIAYFEHLQPTDVLRHGVDSCWPRITRTKTGLVILNRIWSINPDLHLSILKLACSRPVILADETLPDSSYLSAHFTGTVYSVNLQSTREGCDSPIRLNVRAH